MQQAAAGITGKIGRDPVCGMNVEEDRSKAEGNVRQYKGKAYFFCSPGCRNDFGKAPERYLKSSVAAGRMPPPPFTGAAGMNQQPMKATDSGHAHD